MSASLWAVVYPSPAAGWAFCTCQLRSLSNASMAEAPKSRGGVRSVANGGVDILRRFFQLQGTVRLK